MNSDLIGKIEKARRYAEEPSRVSLGELKASFRGENSDYEIGLADGSWSCNCAFFTNWGTCAHVMAMQKIFTPMLDEKALQVEGPYADEDMTVDAVA